MKINKLTKVFLMTISFSLNILYAVPGLADDETRRGVTHTQELIRNPEFRANNVKDSEPAAELDQHIKGLTKDPANEQEIYSLAAEVMGNMKDLTPEQMAKIVEQAQKDPSAFAESFTPAQKSKLHEIADRIPAAKAK